MTLSIRSVFCSLVSFGALLGAWASCGSDDADIVAPVYKYPATAEFCQGIAKASCSSAVVTGCGLASQLTCQGAVEGKCTRGEIEPSRRVASGQAFQPAQAEVCVTAVETAHADALISPDELSDINTKCDLVFSSAITAGGSCTSKADCAPELDCFANGATSTCQVPVVVNPGFSCTTPGSVCQDQPTQDFFCSAGNCIAKSAAAGAVCTPGSDACPGDARCIASTPAAANEAITFTCQPKLDNGANCAANEECQSGICNLALNPADRNQTIRRCLTSIQLNNIDAAVCQNYQ